MRQTPSRSVLTMLPGKILTCHFDRQALVHIRWSKLQQTEQHRESTSCPADWAVVRLWLDDPAQRARRCADRVLIAALERLGSQPLQAVVLRGGLSDHGHDRNTCWAARHRYDPHHRQATGGAEVVRAERVGAGEDFRSLGQPWVQKADGTPSGEAAYFQSANRGKHSLTPDFAQPPCWHIALFNSQLTMLLPG
jgi:hypothetical protein